MCNFTYISHPKTPVLTVLRSRGWALRCPLGNCSSPWQPFWHPGGPDCWGRSRWAGRVAPFCRRCDSVSWLHPEKDEVPRNSGENARRKNPAHPSLPGLGSAAIGSAHDIAMDGDDPYWGPRSAWASSCLRACRYDRYAGQSIQPAETDFAQ